MSKKKALSSRGKRAFLFAITVGATPCGCPKRLGIAEVEGEGFAIQSNDELVEDVAAQEDV